MEIEIFMTTEEAEKFKLFQKHFDTFNLMVERQVFDQKGATITLNFDKFGILRNIGRADFLYIYGADFKNDNKKKE